MRQQNSNFTCRKSVQNKARFLIKKAKKSNLTSHDFSIKKTINSDAVNHKIQPAKSIISCQEKSE